MYTISMANIFRGLERSTYQNTCNHEHVINLSNIHLAFMLSGSMNNLNSRETT